MDLKTDTFKLQEYLLFVTLWYFLAQEALTPNPAVLRQNMETSHQLQYGFNIHREKDKSTGNSKFLGNFGGGDNDLTSFDTEPAHLGDTQTIFPWVPPFVGCI